MKFIRFSVVDSTKLAEVSNVSDKIWTSPPKGTKIQALYSCLGMAFPEQPPNTIVAIAVLEAESAESLAATSYPLMLAGANVWAVPVAEITVGGAAKLEKKLKG